MCLLDNLENYRTSVLKSDFFESVYKMDASAESCITGIEHKTLFDKKKYFIYFN